MQSSAWLWLFQISFDRQNGALGRFKMATTPNATKTWPPCIQHASALVYMLYFITGILIIKKSKVLINFY